VRVYASGPEGRVSDGIVCPECRGINTPDAKSCRHCLSSLRGAQTARAAPAAAASAVALPRMREVQEVLEGEERLLYVLRWAYILYAGAFAARAAAALFSAAFEVPGPRVLANVLLALVGLCFVVVAIRHLVNEPFACAVALAGLQTISLANAILEVGVEASQYWLAVTGLLWLAVLATARSGRILREWQSDLAFDGGRSDEIRTVLAILLIYAGTIALLLLGPDEPFWGEIATYAGITVLGVGAALLLGPRSFGDTFPIRCAWGRSLLLALAVTAVDLVVAWWLVGLLEGEWTPPSPAPTGALVPEELLLSVALPALTEEWLCRGVLWSAIRRGAGTTATILVTATLFALLHRTGDRAHAVVPLQLLGGLALGWLRARTGSLIPCMLAHAAFNATVIAML
jgi:membrane protease YdiL (CAAX protease family)/ribosomal protein L40E